MESGGGKETGGNKNRNVNSLSNMAKGCIHWNLGSGLLVNNTNFTNMSAQVTDRGRKTKWD